MSKQEILKVITYLAHITMMLSESISRLNYTNGIDFGFENLHQATKKCLPKTVSTFLVLFSNANHK